LKGIIFVRVNDFLKKRRVEKGISDKDFAEITGQSIHWVEDFDDDEEELNGLNVPQFKKMCHTLDLTPSEVFCIVASNLKDLGISELIRKRREEKYWSVDDLSDRVGYESYVVGALEKGSNLNAVCLDALKKIATELDLPFDLVLQKL
jgi:transcriptional regulator with XRE-family HTH domain